MSASRSCSAGQLLPLTLASASAAGTVFMRRALLQRDRRPFSQVSALSEDAFDPFTHRTTIVATRCPLSFSLGRLHPLGTDKSHSRGTRHTHAHVAHAHARARAVTPAGHPTGSLDDCALLSCCDCASGDFRQCLTISAPARLAAMPSLRLPLRTSQPTKRPCEAPRSPFREPARPSRAPVLLPPLLLPRPGRVPSRSSRTAP